jgi:resuscitation-promoting factor RpfA
MTRFDAWLAAAATAGLWICLGWLAVGFVVALLAEAPGTVGRVCGQLAGRVSPQILRRLARCVIGLVFAAVSVTGVGTAANAAAASKGPGWPGQPVESSAAASSTSTTASSAAVSSAAALSRLPDLDRPTLAAGPSGDPGAPRPTRIPRLPTAMPTNPTALPRLPTAAAQPSGSAQPGSGKRGNPDGRSPDEPPSRDRAVVVVPGDTLWDIAARELGGEPSNREIAERWPRWYASNRAVIGADPDLILPGQRLSLPD